MELPEKFEQKMKNLLGEPEFQQYKLSFEEKRVYGLRVNKLKINPEQFEKISPFKLSPVPWCSEGFYYDAESRPAKHPYYHAGLYYLQEPSAMAPGSVFEVIPGENVLDICAAPGGKSTQIAAKLQGKGILISNDISATRAKALLKNIELNGIKNAVILSESPEKLAKSFPEFFNKILIDAPCSGEGMFRKEPDVMKSWGEDMTKFCCEQQTDILENAVKMLAKGGSILYSTCTFAPEENEGLIQKFLNQHTEFELIPISNEFGFENGRPEWIENGSHILCGCARLFPHKIKGEGHFLALLHNKECPESPTLQPFEGVSIQNLTDFNSFCLENLQLELKGKFQIVGDDYYLLPEGMPKLLGTRIMRSGWYLGKQKKNRFEPSQAMAMGLKKEEVKNFIDFPVEDERVMRYLKGESFEVDGIKNGWCLILCEGFPLGWGKMQCGRLKNKYMSGWRYDS